MLCLAEPKLVLHDLSSCLPPDVLFRVCGELIKYNISHCNCFRYCLADWFNQAFLCGPVFAQLACHNVLVNCEQTLGTGPLGLGKADAVCMLAMVC
jgi:hypothetical protein